VCEILSLCVCVCVVFVCGCVRAKVEAHGHNLSQGCACVQVSGFVRILTVIGKSHNEDKVENHVGNRCHNLCEVLDRRICL
jgi:hypothetical protein